MASKLRMSAPVCLIENRGRQFHVCPGALRLLSKIRQPVVVVAIVGLYRMGKSYLMNKLAGKTSGFPLGSTVQANTKGIWMWCIPHPERPNQTLVLLDTEGLGDVEKGDSQNDSWIFALAVLLSSTLVYNSMNSIDQMAMNQLHFVTELMQHIKAKVSSGEKAEGLEDCAELVHFFPNFIWTLRDFALQLELNGRPITADDYLENALKLKKGDTHETGLFNLPRSCIRMFFPTRKCFVFERLTEGKDLRRLEQMQEGELDSDFVAQAAEFCRYVYWTAKEKTIPGGHVVTGRSLAKLVETYVDAICSGKVPCVENGVLALAQIENSAAVSNAVARYVELMKQKVKLPTETVQELLEIHTECEQEALQVFMARAFSDDTQHFQARLMRILNKKKEQYCCENKQESSACSEAVLTSLSQDFECKIRRGNYSRPGGPKCFVDDLKKLEQRYHQIPKKGVMANDILKQFLKGKENVGRAILQTDEALTEQEEKIAVERAQAEAAERAARQQRELLEDTRRILREREWRFEQQQRQLAAKLEADRRRLLDEQAKETNRRLEEQRQLEQERANREFTRLQAETERQQHRRSEDGTCVIL